MSEQHTMSKDCWCEPTVEVVPGPAIDWIPAALIPDPSGFEYLADVPPAAAEDYTAAKARATRERRATAIRLKPHLHDALLVLAAQQERSINWLINEAVREYVMNS